MPLVLNALLALGLVALATFALLERHLQRACGGFVAFAVAVALTWWSVGFPWLALLELVLGAACTGAFLFYALGQRFDPAAPGLDRWHDPLPLTWRRGLLYLVPAVLLLGMLAMALVALAGSPGPWLGGGLGLVGLSLWAFSLHRHLLRRLLAFNVMGTGIFLILMTLARDTAPTAGQGLVVTGLLVALLGTALGSLLIRRLDVQGSLPIPTAGRGGA